MGERHSSVLHDGSAGHRHVLTATNPTIGKQTLQGINLSKTIWLLSGWKTLPGPTAQPCNTRAAWRKDGRRQIEGWGGSVWWSGLGRKTDGGWMWRFRRWDGVDCLCHSFRFKLPPHARSVYSAGWNIFAHLFVVYFGLYLRAISHLRLCVTVIVKIVWCDWQWVSRAVSLNISKTNQIISPVHVIKLVQAWV